MKNKIVYKKLKELASEGKKINYSDLNKECSLGLDFNQSKDRAELGKILGEIAKFEVDNGRPMLSAIVLLKDKLEPAFGFYNYANELGVRKKEESNQDLFWRQLKECFEIWKAKKKRNE